MNRSKLIDFYSIQKIQLSLTGTWPLKNKTPLQNVRFIFISLLSFVLFYMSMGYEVISDLTDFGKLSKILYVFSSASAYWVKMTAFLYNRKLCLKLLDEIDRPIFNSYPVKYDSNMAVLLRIALVLSKTYVGCVLCLIPLYGIYPLVDDEPLPMPFPKKLGAYNPIMYVIQLVGTGVTAWNNSALDNLCANFMSLASGQYDVLKCKVMDVRKNAMEILKMHKDDANQEEVDDVVETLLHECVEHHLAIIRLVELIDGVFSVAILGQFGATIFIMCNSVFSIMMTTPDSMKFLLLVVYFFVATCELTLYCWFGNEVILKSESLRDACYLSDWSECGPRAKKCLFIIMERSKRPVMVTAYKFSVASLTSLKSVIQWSYSYLTVLKSLDNSDN